mmetsp:Transcript_141517/g.246712  ORF Transcript_141517/g.246712 Transcript_141517/m.246712 type:complete len:84 (+) Transcript_141517:7-258(+)
MRTDKIQSPCLLSHHTMLAWMIVVCFSLSYLRLLKRPLVYTTGLRHFRTTYTDFCCSCQTSTPRGSAVNCSQAKDLEIIPQFA